MPEPLESRAAPAVLDLIGGVLSYTAEGTVVNELSIRISENDYVFTEYKDTVTLGSGALAAGFTGGGASSIRGPLAAVTSVQINLGDLNDRLDLYGLVHPLQVDMGGGNEDSVSVSDQLQPQGSIEIKSEDIYMGRRITTATDVTLAADSLTIRSAIIASGAVNLQPSTPGTKIDIGFFSEGEVSGRLNLTDEEIDYVTASVLRIGSSTSGDLRIDGPITVTNTPTLALISGGEINGKGSFPPPAGKRVLSVSNLRMEAANIQLGNVRSDSVDVDTLAVKVTHDNGLFSLRGAWNYQIGTVDGQVGLVTGASGKIYLEGGYINQAPGARIQTPDLHVNSLGTVTLNATSNHVERLQVTHKSNYSFSYTDAGDFVLLNESVFLRLELHTPGTVTQGGPITETPSPYSTTASIAFHGPGQLVLTEANPYPSVIMYGGTIKGGGSLDLGLSVQSGATFAPTGNFTAGEVVFQAGSEFSLSFDGGVHDRATVFGALGINGTLHLSASTTPLPETEFVIIDHINGNVPVSGHFTGLPEGAPIAIGDQVFRISYRGGDGNDVTLRPFLEVEIVDGKTARYIDIDGDIVTVKTSKGILTAADFVLTGSPTTGDFGIGIRFSDDGQEFAGANITVTAKRGLFAGNGFANISLIDAFGVPLGAVNIAGDLGRIVAGDGSVIPAVKSLTAQSMGYLGSLTQLDSEFHGDVPKLTLKNDLRGGVNIVGKLGSAVIGGSIVSGGSGLFHASTGINSLSVGGDLRASSQALTISTEGPIGTMQVGGSIVGSDSAHVIIRAFGQTMAPGKGLDLAIKTLSVRGSVERTEVLAGVDPNALNADASIGSITVGVNWIESTVLAGTDPMDAFPGTADDAKVGGRDQAGVFSTIGSFTIKGQAVGSTDPDSDARHGIVAEQINKASIGGVVLPLKAATKESIPAAATYGQAGAASNFILHELGGVASLGNWSIGLTIATNGRTATFTDADGDLVTVKTNKGAFQPSNFTFATSPRGGGQLQKLSLGPDFSGAVVSITATPRLSGGNGFVNVGSVETPDLTLASLTVDGDLASFVGGAGGKPAVGTLTVHSMGLLSRFTGVPAVESEFFGGLGKLNILTDLRDATVTMPGSASSLGSVAIGGSMVSSTPGHAVLWVAGNIGSIKITGSMHGGRIESDFAIGSIAIGGDLLGDGSVSISAYGQIIPPTKGVDLALKSITVGGNMEEAVVAVGTRLEKANADASIGSISVGRVWLGASVIAGVDIGGDRLIGTADDRPFVGSNETHDQPLLVPQIASIVIKGQAMGTEAITDGNGIIAQQIGKVVVGKVAFPFIKGSNNAEDRYYLAPTYPGPNGFDLIAVELR